MTLENVVATVLSVDFLFGAATATAFAKGVKALFQSVLGRAANQPGEPEQTNVQ